jgi:two-component system, NarL family, response regulator DesR
MSDQTTVLIADVDPGIVGSVSKFLSDRDLDVVAVAGNGDEALAKIEQELPSIALLDIQMPGLSGVEVTRRAVLCAPQTAVILFNGDGNRDHVSAALDAGAGGFLMKDASFPELHRAIEVVARGGTFVDASLSAALVVPEHPVLTPREREVLRLLSNGDRYGDAGRKLYLSTATVRKVVGSIRVKLGAATGTEAVATALRLSLIA